MTLWRGLGASVDDLAQAIARFEGFLVPGSIAQKDNNPGNLRAGVGQTGTDANGFAIFPDVATGYSALDNQIQLNINKGLTLDQFFGGLPGVYPGYAPAADSNNPAQYATTVGGWIGIDPTVQLSSIITPSTGSSVLADPSAPVDSSLGASISDSFTSIDTLSLPSLSDLSTGSWLAIGAVVLVAGWLAFR
jgi:hypothetical protein